MAEIIYHSTPTLSLHILSYACAYITSANASHKPHFRKYDLLWLPLSGHIIKALYKNHTRTLWIWLGTVGLVIYVHICGPQTPFTHFPETEVTVAIYVGILWFKFNLATFMNHHTVLGYKVVCTRFGWGMMSLPYSMCKYLCDARLCLYVRCMWCTNSFQGRTQLTARVNHELWNSHTSCRISDSRCYSDIADEAFCSM